MSHRIGLDSQGIAAALRHRRRHDANDYRHGSRPLISFRVFVGSGHHPTALDIQALTTGGLPPLRLPRYRLRRERRLAVKRTACLRSMARSCNSGAVPLTPHEAARLQY